MYLNEKILIGKTKEGKELSILLDKANRHGLITGASGSGKTITSKVMAESFSEAGIPVFMADVKGDLAGTALPGEPNENVDSRVEKLKLENFEYQSYPVRFWDIFGDYGHPVRTTLDSVGPEILSMMLGLTEAQEGVLTVVFKIAKDNEWELDKIEDLRLLLQYVGDNREKFTTSYGNVTTQSVGVIQRCLLALENQGGDKFFGLPELDINDFLSTDANGKGIINILHAVRLFESPDLFASFLLWILTTLYTKMPEVGDLDKPKMVFFFDEAHLLFNGMPDYRLKRIVQVVRLIRSRGIGLYFISQSPADIPNEVIAQLGNRVQHNLRAYTPTELKTVKTAADSFRSNPGFNTYDEILALGTGEALISFQNENGEPEVVEKAKILPPQSKMGVIDETSRNKVINSSTLVGKYDEPVERESAFEEISELNRLVKEKIEAEAAEKQAEKDAKEQAKKEAEEQKAADKAKKEEERKAKEELKAQEKAAREAEKAKKNNPMYKLGKKAVNSAETKIINKLLNKLFKGFK